MMRASMVGELLYSGRNVGTNTGTDTGGLMKIRKITMFLFLLVATGAMFAQPAVADPIPAIDFQGFFGGTISYAGGNSALIGSNIAVDFVQGINTPLNAQPGPFSLLAVTDAALSFNTGAGSGLGNHSWSGTAGNFFTIVGDIDDLNLDDVVLLSGTFGTASVENSATLVVTLGPDQKHPALLAYYGLPADQFFEFSGAIHLSAPPQAGAFESSVASINVMNYAVPEPTSLLLLSSGLLGLAGMMRLRRK
jgi:hypothetical protein